jgi:hypothetical protein
MKGDAEWERCVPPLRALTAEQRDALFVRLNETEWLGQRR